MNAYRRVVLLAAVGLLGLLPGHLTAQQFTGIITTFAGTGTAGFSGDGGAATQAQLRTPMGVAVDSSGNVYIVDRDNHRVRRVGTDGRITTFAGTGTDGFSGDGDPATQAQFFTPEGVAVDGRGNVYIADLLNHRVRRVGTDGRITTFAGSGETGLAQGGFSGDGGPASQARLYNPAGVAVDSSGNVYIADTVNHRVRRVGADGRITTFAGSGATGFGLGGFSGDGGPASQARLYNPVGVAVDRGGNVYIADTVNNRVRRVGADGTITTFAGTGNSGSSGDGGPASQAQLNKPAGVAVDRGGNVYIGDLNNHRVRRVGTDGTITTFAGTGTSGFSGEGVLATQAQLYNPVGVAVDRGGNVYIGDSNNHRVRRVAAQQAAPAISLSATSLAFDSTTVGSTSQKTLTIKNTGTASLSVTGITVTGTDAAQFTVSPATATVAAGDSAKVTVTFAPTSAGAKSASLSVAHNASGSPSAVGLTGVGKAAVTQPPSAAAWTNSSTGLGITIINDLGVTGQTVYAVGSSSSAVGFAGVYKSANGGNTWTASSSGLPLSIFTVCAAFAIDPVNPQTVYVGGNPDLNGVYKSTNGGSSWAAAKTGLPELQWVNDLAIDPKTPQTVYAGTQAGVYKTTNGGTAWTAVNTGLPTTANNIAALEIDPSNAQTVYALGKAVYKSTNGGTAWAAASTGIPANASLSDIAIDPAGSVYVGTAADILTGKGAGVFKSTNGGTSWTAVNLVLPDFANVNALAIDPSNPQTVYAGTDSGVVMSTNGGTSWTAINAGLPAANPVIVALAIGPQTIYAGGGANIYTRPLSGSSAQQAPTISLSPATLAFDSTTVGSTSQKTLTIKNTGTASLSVTGITVTGTDAAQFTASPATATVAAGDSAKVTVTFAPTSAGSKSASLSVAHNATGSPSVVALTGVGKAAVTQPPPASNTWTAVNTGLTNTNVGDLAMDPKTPQTVYAGTLGGVFKTMNGGTAWAAVNTGLTNTSVVALAIDPSSPQALYAGTGEGVFKTTNGGTSWARSGTSLSSFNVLAINPSNPQTVYAGTGSSVLKTTDGGANWTPAATGLPGLTFTVFALAIDPKTPQTLYVSVRFRGVFKTTDGGTSWAAATTGIPEGTQVYGLAVDPSTPQTVYAGSASGVFKTMNGGTSWTAANTGLTNTGVISIEMDPSNPQTLYAGTDGGGVFRSTDGAATWSAFNAGLPDQTTVNAFAVDPSNSQTVYAGTGTGVYKSIYVAPQAPALGLSATAIRFDSTKAGATSQKFLTVSNTGTAALSVGTITNSNAAAFTVSPTSLTLAANASGTITVTFAPASAGSFTGTLTIPHNATGSPATVSLSGVGTAASTQPPPTTTIPDPAKQDETKLGIWLDFNTATGNQMVASASTLPGAEVPIQVFGRNLTSATSFGVTLTYDSTAVSFVGGEKFQIGDYLPGAISLAPQVTVVGGVKQVTFGAALLGGSPKSGNGYLGTVVFKVSDKFTEGYTEIKVTKLTLGTGTATIQTSNAILKALKNSPPIARFDIKPDAIKAGDTKNLITLDASGSSDPDKDPITFKWTGTTGLTFKKSTSDTSRVAQVQIADSTKSNVVFTLTVMDKNGAKSTATETLRFIPRPTSSTLVTMDLDPAADDQGADLQYGVKGGEAVTAQIFVKNLTGVTGYTVKFTFDSTKLESPAYANGTLIKGTFIPLTQYTAGSGFIQGGGSTLPVTANSGSGLLATFTFKTSSKFEGSTTLSVTSINLQAGSTRNEMITTPIVAEITSDVPVKSSNPANFTESGTVGFEDFFLFAGQFDTKVGDKNWDARFDLNGDGKVDFEDFFVFAAVFGLIE